MSGKFQGIVLGLYMADFSAEHVKMIICGSHIQEVWVSLREISGGNSGQGVGTLYHMRMM